MANIDRSFEVPNGLSLDNETGLFTGILDPDTNSEVAPRGSIYTQKPAAGDGAIWWKHGDGDTEWTKILAEDAITHTNIIAGDGSDHTFIDQDVTSGSTPTFSADNIQRDFFNGSIHQSFDALVTSDGATITMSLEQSGGGDLTMLFSDGMTTLDCTPAATIALTAGTDASPQENFIYIPQSTKVLTKSTTGWLSAEHIKIGYFFVPSATYVQADGVYINQNWNDHQAGTDNQGHMLHMAERIRRMGSVYFSGIDGAGADDYTTSGAGTVTVQSTAGVIYQMHSQAFGAKDTSVSDDVHVINATATDGGAYVDLTNLYDITEDSAGGSLTNKYFNIVLWGVANKGGEYGPLMVTLPSGAYNNQSDAESDASGYDDFTIPRQFKLESSTGFLIARLTFRKTGGSWTYQSTVDLRGQTPTTASGGGVGGTITSFQDTLFNVYDNLDATKRIFFQASGITTATDRTFTMPDGDGTIPLATGLAGGQTLIGGTASGDDLTIQSTSNATKGDVFLGSDGKVKYDETNTRLVINADGDTTTDFGSIHIKNQGGIADGLVFEDSDAPTTGRKSVIYNSARDLRFTVMDEDTTNQVEHMQIDSSSGLIINDNQNAVSDFVAKGDTDASLFTVDASGDKVGVGVAVPNELLTVNGIVSLAETTAPTLTAGFGKLYVKSSDSKLYFMDDSGSETDLLAAAGGGEVNTASSAGTGTSLFYQKSVADLQFNAIKSENSLLTIALDGVTHDVELTVDETAITHANIIAGDGSDHTFIDQSVTTSASPTFVNLSLVRTDANPDLDFYRTDATIGNNDYLGRFLFGGSDGGANTNAAEIIVVADLNAWDVGDQPTGIRFDTTPAASTTAREVARIGGETFTVNPDSIDYDFQVNGDVVASLIKADAGVDQVGIGTASVNELLTVNGIVSLAETTAPTLTSGFGKIYVKSSDSKLYFMDDSGAETDLTAGGGGTPGDQAVVQARRTTTYTLTTSYVDITLDTTDVENDNTVIDHDLVTNTDRITCKETGVYRISYHVDLPVPGATITVSVQAQMRVNDTTAINGSYSQSGVMDDAQAQMGQNSLGTSFIADLTANDYITLQLKKTNDIGSGTYTTEAGLIVTVERLTGEKGATGAAGGGDITGPVSSTDNAIVRWDGTGGDTIQDSSVTIDDSNNIVTTGTFQSERVTTDKMVWDNQTISYAASITPDANDGGYIIVGQLTGDIAVNAMSNDVAGEHGVFKFTTDGTDRTITWNANYLTPGGYTTTVVPASTTTVVYWWSDGTNVYLSAHGDMS